MIGLATVKIDFAVVLEVDKNKCIGCGICVDVCPSHLWYLDVNRKAEPRDNYEPDCFICHACAVSCPVGAIVVREEVWERSS